MPPVVDSALEDRAAQPVEAAEAEASGLCTASERGPEATALRLVVGVAPPLVTM
jgi:hypothetical protein